MRSLLAAAALFALAAPALAQDAGTPAHAPIPKAGRLVQQGEGVPIEDQAKTGQLPGVGMDAKAQTEGDTIKGPGGLQNGTGAVGTMAPSTSSSNPVPVESGSDDDDFGIPLDQPDQPESGSTTGQSQ